MSWDDARQHEKQYREKRWKALNNEQKQEWFTTPVSSLSELIDKYKRDDENEQWKKEYIKKHKADIKKLTNWRIRIASLCSSTRDIRTQFAARSERRARSALDWDRFEFQRLGFNDLKLDNLDQIVKDFAGGMKKLS